MNKLSMTVKIYLEGLKSPITLLLDNKTQLDKLDLLLNDDNDYVSFGCINFSKDKFICYIFE